MAVVYTPTILCSLAEIRKVFAVPTSTIRQWAQEGAPIVIEGEGNHIRYSTEVIALQTWRLQRSNMRSTQKNG